jgi:antitoxin (DNA-binding transcriptional repressor) of toxin-antitoxin stability system
MLRIAKAEARKRFSEVVTRAGRRGERVKITHYGRTIAILVSPRDLETLDECEQEMKSGGRAGAAAPHPGSTPPRRRPGRSPKRR